MFFVDVALYKVVVDNLVIEIERGVLDAKEDAPQADVLTLHPSEIDYTLENQQLDQINSSDHDFWTN